MLGTLAFQDERAKEEVEREDGIQDCGVRGKQVESFEKQGVVRFASALEVKKDMPLMKNFMGSK